jgi:hypothetical protein
MSCCKHSFLLMHTQIRDSGDAEDELTRILELNDPSRQRAGSECVLRLQKKTGAVVRFCEGAPLLGATMMMAESFSLSVVRLQHVGSQLVPMFPSLVHDCSCPRPRGTEASRNTFRLSSDDMRDIG